MNNPNQYNGPKLFQGLLTKITDNYKDYRIRCNNCQHEGLIAEFGNGCPKCGNRDKLVPISSSGQTMEQLGLRKKGVRQRSWLMMISAIILFITYKLVELKLFLPILIAVIVVDVIIIKRRENDV